MLTVSPSFLVLFEPDSKHEHVREFGVEMYQVCLEIRDLLECGAVAMPLQGLDASNSNAGDDVAFFLQLHVRTLDGVKFCEREDTAHAWCVVFWMSTREELHEVTRGLLSYMEIVRRENPGRQNSLTAIPFPCLDCISEFEATAQVRLKQQMKTSQLRNFLSTEAKKASGEEVVSPPAKAIGRVVESAGREPPLSDEVTHEEEEAPVPVDVEPVASDIDNLGIVIDPGTVSKPILTEHLAIALWEYLPATVRVGDGIKWVLRYTPKAHGISLQTLFRNCEKHDMTLLLVQDAENHVFGGFAAEPWEISTRFYGSGEAFVFSFGQLTPDAVYDTPPVPSIFTWTAANNYFMFSDDAGIAMGGGNGRHAIFLASGLLRGCSGPTETFGNPTLAAGEEFVVKDMEIWAFEEE